jgi:hypothetical protein
MPSPGTTYGDCEITLAFDDVVGDEEEKQIQDTLQEFTGLREGFHVGYYLPALSILLP